MLLSAKQRLRFLLTLYLCCQLILPVALASLPLFFRQHFAWLPGSAYLLVLFPLLTAVHLIFLAWQVMVNRAEGRDWAELDVPAERMQRLTALVHEVADQLELPPPDEIRLAATGLAHVYETAQGQRILVLGGMPLAALSQKALSALIAHELVHLGLNDAALTRRSSIIQEVFESLCEELAEHPKHWLSPGLLLTLPIHLASRAYWAAQARRCERIADTYAALHAGTENTAAALVYASVVEQLPWTKLSSIIEAYLQAELPASQIFAESADLAKRADLSTWLAVCAQEMSKATGWFDLHPSLYDRLARLGVSHVDALHGLLDQADPPTSALFEDWSLLEQQLGDRLVHVYRWVQERRAEHLSA